MARRGRRAVGAGSKRRPGPRRGRPAAAGTRDDLLRAGAEVFGERGFEGATAERIARRAGATKAMINYHFGSKEDLYEAILLATFTEISGRLEAVRTAGGSAPDQLRAFIEAFARAAGDNPAFAAMMVREALSGGPHLPRPALPRIVGVLGVVRSIVEQGIAEGTFRPVDSLLTHMMVVGSLLFFLATEPFRSKAAAVVMPPGGPPTTAAYVAHVQELMVRGLAADAAPRRRS